MAAFARVIVRAHAYHLSPKRRAILYTIGSSPTHRARRLVARALGSLGIGRESFPIKLIAAIRVVYSFQLQCNPRNRMYIVARPLRYGD